MNRSIVLLVLLVLVVCLASCGDDEGPPTNGAIEGRVSTTIGDTAIVGALVTTSPPTSAVSTTSQGTYSIEDVAPGQYEVQASMGGYNPATVSIAVTAGGTTTANIHLTSILANTPPLPPALIAPADALTDQPTNLTLLWSGHDPDLDPLTYDVYLAESSPPPLLVSTAQTDTSYTTATLLPSTTYFWRVYAKDNRGGVTPSVIRSFATRLDTIPSNGLVAYYPFTGNANDESGNGNSGTVYGATLTTDRKGNPRTAYYFNGSDDYIDCGDPSNGSLDMAASENFTISLWFSTTMTPSWYPIILSKDFHNYPGNNDRVGYEIILVQGSPVSAQAEVWINGTGYGNAVTQSGINSGNWHHIVQMRSGFVLTLYFDGARIGDAPCTNGDISNSQHLTIGKHSYNPGFDKFNGKVDDIRIYKRGLSESEILHLYNE